jgi:hypothetical protein
MKKNTKIILVVVGALMVIALLCCIGSAIIMKYVPLTTPGVSSAVAPVVVLSTEAPVQPTLTPYPIQPTLTPYPTATRIPPPVPTHTSIPQNISNDFVEEEVTCPDGGLPEGFSSMRCFDIASSYNAYGFAYYNSSRITGIAVSFNEGCPEYVTQATADFIVEVAGIAGWSMDDLYGITELLSNASNNEPVVYGSIGGMHKMSRNTNLVLFVLTNKNGSL